MIKLETLIILSISIPVFSTILIIVCREFKIRKIKKQLVDENKSSFIKIENTILNLKEKGWPKYRYFTEQTMKDTENLLSNLNGQLSNLEKKQSKSFFSLNKKDLVVEIEKELLNLKIERLNLIKINPEYSKEKKHLFYKGSEDCYRFLFEFTLLWESAENKANEVLKQLGQSTDDLLINNGSDVFYCDYNYNIEEITHSIEDFKKHILLMIPQYEIFTSFVSSYLDTYEIFVDFDFNFDFNRVLNILSLENQDEQIQILKKELNSMKNIIKLRKETFKLKADVYLDILY